MVEISMSFAVRDHAIGTQGNKYRAAKHIDFLDKGYRKPHRDVLGDDEGEEGEQRDRGSAGRASR